MKMWYIHIIDYHSIIFKKWSINTCSNIKFDNMLTERTRRVYIVRFCVCEMSRISKFKEMENWLVVSGSWCEKEMVMQ